MAEGRPWHKRYHSDALNGMRGLDLEQRGAFNTFLDLLYDSGEEGLPDNEAVLAAYMGCNTRKWRRIRAELVALNKIEVIAGGRLSNARYRRERVEFMRQSEKRRKAAKAQSEPDLFNDINETSEHLPEDVRNDAKNSDSAMFGHSLPQTKAKLSQSDAVFSNEINAGPSVRARVPESEIEDGKTVSTVSPSGRTGIESPLTPLAAFAAELASIAGMGTLKPKQREAAEAQVQAWRDLGIADDAMRTVVRNFTRSAKAPTRSLKRFDDHMRLEQAQTATKPAEPKRPAMVGNDDDDPRLSDLRKALKQTVGPVAYARDLEPLAFHVNGSGLIVEAASAFYANWTEQHYGPAIAKHVKRLDLGNRVTITTAKP